MSRIRVVIESISRRLSVTNFIRFVLLFFFSFPVSVQGGNGVFTQLATETDTELCAGVCTV